MEEKGQNASLLPLVEAIFELRWKLVQPDPRRPPEVDKNYKLAVGALFSKLHDDYPVHEQLPSSALPDEISAYVVQHRFRTSGAGWPLIQVGQGILTVNDVPGYTWELFQPRVEAAVKILLDVYREMAGELPVSTLVLRYANAVEFDFEKQNALGFLRENMGLGVDLPVDLKSRFAGENPNAIDLSLQFQAANPENSDVTMRFFRGVKNTGATGLMWESSARAKPDSIQSDITSIMTWAGCAHSLLLSIFNTLTAHMQKAEVGD
jgi:uncharacterized protein (TIGR04255 family)